MTKYVKLISADMIENAPYEKDGVINYNLETNETQLFADGYKKLIEIERPETDRHYKIQYQNYSATEITEIVTYTETEEQYAARKLSEAKTAKKNENDFKRSSIKSIKAYFSATESGYLLKSTPVGDIMTVVMGIALPSMMAQQPIPAETMRYYDADGNQHPTPEIAASFVPTFYQRFASAVAGIDAYSASIDDAIKAATTIAEVNAIVIDYTVIGAL